MGLSKRRQSAGSGLSVAPVFRAFQLCSSTTFFQANCQYSNAFPQVSSTRTLPLSHLALLQAVSRRGGNFFEEFFMYHKFFIGFFIAAFVCGLMLCFGGVAEASMLGSFPDIQCAAPVLVKPLTNFVIILITVAAIFL